MSKKFLPITLAALLLLLAPHAVKAQTCGSPGTCSGTNNAAALNGNYACIAVDTSGNQTKVSLTTLAFDGSGMVAVKSASNDNGSTTSTYSDFATQSGFQYCLNADNITGIISSFSGTGKCPLTFAVGSGGKTLRLIGAEQNDVHVATCAHQ